MDSVVKFVGFVVLAFLFIVGVSLLLAYPTMWVVNYLFTPQILLTVFGVPALSFWKALILNCFASIMFKSSNSSSKKD